MVLLSQQEEEDWDQTTEIHHCKRNFNYDVIVDFVNQGKLSLSFFFLACIKTNTCLKIEITFYLIGNNANVEILMSLFGRVGKNGSFFDRKKINPKDFSGV